MAFNTLPRGYQIDPQLGAVYYELPASADDLTLIRGIGTRETVALNRLGVYFIGQVAKWQDHHIAAFATELGMSTSTICRQQWVEQAHAMTMPQGVSAEPAYELPAPGSRTAAVLVSALLIGCFVVYWLNRQPSRPMTGVLAADITSLRVPENSQLLATHVAAGDEVFTGQTLLTIEKLEHLGLINRQKLHVRELQEGLRRAEAQALLDLEWRTRELDRELSEVRSRVQLIRRLDQNSDGHSESVKGDSADARFRPVSSRRGTLRKGHRRLNSLLFISGRSDSSNLETRTALAPQRIIPNPVADTASGGCDLLLMEDHSVELRLQRLEKQRGALPTQVRMAAGLENLRLQYNEASRKLDQMKELSREVAVLCPAYGTIGLVRYREGDRMAEGEVMLQILHTDRRYVVVHAPTRRLNELQLRTEIRLGFPGDADFDGLVANVPVLADSQLSGGESVASIRIEPHGRHWPEIPIGSQVQVAPR